MPSNGADIISLSQLRNKRMRRIDGGERKDMSLQMIANWKAICPAFLSLPFSFLLFYLYTSGFFGLCWLVGLVGLDREVGGSSRRGIPLRWTRNKGRRWRMGRKEVRGSQSAVRVSIKSNMQTIHGCRVPYRDCN